MKTLPLLLLAATAAQAATPDDLLRAYPDFLARIEGQTLVWRDGARMPLGPLSPAADEPPANPSLTDQLAADYPAFTPLLPPTADPGRARNKPFFDKMYGDCRANQVAPRLVRILWLPKTLAQPIAITAVNGVDRALQAVSGDLDALPPEDRKYLSPLAGTYNCRTVAGTSQTSMHAWAAAIDLNVEYADYWRWRRQGAYQNQFPAEIIAAFERHGFIWGGRWRHYDTMHFEYRPELLPPP